MQILSLSIRNSVMPLITYVLINMKWVMIKSTLKIDVKIQITLSTRKYVIIYFIPNKYRVLFFICVYLSVHLM